VLLERLCGIALLERPLNFGLTLAAASRLELQG